MTRRQWATRLLRRALPSPLQTVALDVCTNADTAAFDNWRRHIGTTAESRRILGHSSERLRRLLSLIYVRFQEHGVVVDRSLTTYLRLARAREQLRTESVQQICEKVLRDLSSDGISPIVIGGMAVAETVYPDPAARHCHDLDLLLPTEQMDAASGILARSGFRPTTRTGASASSRWHIHSSKFPIGLHSSPYRVYAWNSDARELIRRSRPASIAGCGVRVLSVEDELMHICCSGLAAGRRHSPCWPADAWFLISRSRTEVDWDAFVAIARTTDRAPAVLIALEYLERELRTAIPGGVLQQLSSTPPRNAGIEAMAAAALVGNYGRRLGLIRRSGKPADMARTTMWAMRARLEPT